MKLTFTGPTIIDANNCSFKDNFCGGPKSQWFELWCSINKIKFREIKYYDINNLITKYPCYSYPHSMAVPRHLRTINHGTYLQDAVPYMNNHPLWFLCIGPIQYRHVISVIYVLYWFGAHDIRLKLCPLKSRTNYHMALPQWCRPNECCASNH